ncbi:methyltransferase domain-containing protein [Candidatus Bathyarchaeota archaeon]|nr:methyltransferase domain-containing protein [Candidatus Bathyarchaeota archaeon]
MSLIDIFSRIYRFSSDVIKSLERVYQNDLEKVLQALKMPGKRYYFRVNTLKADLNEVFRSLRNKGFQVEMDENISEAFYVTVEGPFNIPFFNKRLVVDKFTAEAVLQGAHVYAPGIINCKGIKIGDEVTIVDEFGQEVGSGVARMNETQILQFRKGLAIQLLYPKYKIPSFRETEEYKKGLIYPQSFPAILTSRILEPKPGEKILDVCCAPGGKLSHIVQLMKNKGLVIGVDRNKKKIETTMKNLNCLNCKIATLIIHDSRYIDVDFPSLKVDKCLVDPPCSALGVTPKVFDFTSIKEILNLSNYQKQFIKSASKILKPNGILVYSICTMTIEECEEIAKFAEEECSLKIESQNFFFGSHGINIFLNTEKLQRFHPHMHGLGYFIAKFRKG